MRLRYYDMHLFIILSIISVSFSASLSSNESNRDQDRTALLALRDGFISRGTPLDGSALSSWNSSLHFCQWQDVTCGKRHKRVSRLRLGKQNLEGVVSPSIGNLTFLRELDLEDNSLHGEVPRDIGHLWRLQFLYLIGNFFQGNLPVELSNCTNLQRMIISYNNFSGLIPFQFGSLWKLTLLTVSENNLVGEMPSFLTNFSSLIALDLAANHFNGEMHNSLQGLSNLALLSLQSNNFSGTISLLYNLSSLRELDISRNQFTGTLAQDIDVAFPKSTFLSLSDNNFTGVIPSSLSNISGLTVFQINNNSFKGRVPNNIGTLKYLKNLQLGSNLLGNEESNDLSFLDSLTNCTKLKRLYLNDNRFGGPLPDVIANFSSSLVYLSMWGNYITGSIPEGIGELSNLSFITFRGKLLTGLIPNSIGKLGNISILDFSENNLHGGIPSSIGNLTKLLILYLEANSLNCNIPSTLGNCKDTQKIDISNNHLNGSLLEDSISVFSQLQNLRYCDVSRNSFDGKFPLVSVKLGVMIILDVSYNNFSGEIPNYLGEAVQLEYLNMAGNSFEGIIPAPLGRLRSLLILDLSNNNLSGPIPKDLASIGSLQFLNLSFNKLEGEVPFFINVSAVSVVGNSALCGGNPELHLQTCKHYLKKAEMISRKAVIAISLSALTSLFLLAIMCIFICSRRKHKMDDIDSLAERYQRITYRELFKATDGFADSNLIDSGSFGDVYRAIIDQNESTTWPIIRKRCSDKPVAVKVLKLSNHGAAKSFVAECKVLRRIQHRNLLRIVTICSSLDYKGNDFKALVFDFMSNGNLHDWLHFKDSQVNTRFLTLAKRLEIAIDVGSALDYLQNDCETPIIHCDLKPSNILLDDNMVAHVGDFGLAKLLLDVSGDFSGGESMSAALKGSIGYIAPEYGMGAAVSPQGDLYSFGILLLELITGKRPTDDIFNEEMSLQSFCRRALPDLVEDIVDQSLLDELHEVIMTQRNPNQIKLEYHAFLISFVEVGISCATEFPKDRMDIQSVGREFDRRQREISADDYDHQSTCGIYVTAYTDAPAVDTPLSSKTTDLTQPQIRHVASHLHLRGNFLTSPARTPGDFTNPVVQTYFVTSSSLQKCIFP